MIRAIHDSALVATVLRRTPLHYSAGPDETRDRPGHVRSGSGIAHFCGKFAVVQDDASFIALVDAGGREVDAIALDHEKDGRRQFDDGRGNKHHKLDLEACFSFQREGREALIAFGSGSLPARERVVWVDAPSRQTRVREASALYAVFRSQRDFSGSELNIEGAALVRVDGREVVRFFQRGNGAPLADTTPVDATADLDWDDLLRYLAEPAATGPRIERVVAYDLGSIDGVRLTFTDACAEGDRVFFLAAAEDSPDAVGDGPVAGAVLGVIDADGGARYAPIRHADGSPFREKAEGLTSMPGAPDRFLAVLDLDDPDAPTELCEIAIAGPYRGAR